MSKRIRSGNIIQVNHKQLKKIIKRAYYTKEPIFIEGPIGVGKSYTARDAAMELAQELSLEFIETKMPNQHVDKFCFVDQRIAQKDAGEVMGLPDNYALVKVKGRFELIPVRILPQFVDRDDYKDVKIVDYITKWNKPGWMPYAGHGIIFLDEFNLAPPLVQAVCYELINDRCFGDYTLPDGYIVIGAGNRGPLDGAPTFDFGDPLNDRFSWYELGVPSVEDWTEWALQHGIDHRIIGFINTNNSALYTHKPGHREKAFATPRSWERASNLIKGVYDEEEVMLYVSGRVGTYVAEMFRAFLEARRKLPPVEEFIRNPDTMPIPENLDLLYTLCTNLVDYFIHHKTRETLRSIVVFANRLTAEFAVFLLKLVKSTDEAFFKRNILEIKEYSPFVARLSPYFDIVGE